jgi:hypothetical protein
MSEATTPTTDAKQANMTYFDQQLPKLLSDPLMRHKWVVVQGGAIREVRDSFEAALRVAIANYPASEFVVQQVIGRDETINFIRAAS